MTLIDSSVWIAFFNGKKNTQTDQLGRKISQHDEILTLPLIVGEVLCGFRNDLEFQKAKRVLERIPALPLTTETHVHAAQLYRNLRKKGVTPGGLTDCIIAEACMEFDVELLTQDSDFGKIVKHYPLKLLR